MNLTRYTAGLDQLCKNHRISRGGLLVMMQAYEADQPIGLDELIVGPRRCWSHALGRDADMSLFRFIEEPTSGRPYVLMTLSAKGRRLLDALCAHLEDA